MTEIFYRDNSNIVEVIELRNAVSGAYLNAATVTITLTQNGEDVAGETWPLILAYVAASNGHYRATLSHVLEVSAFTWLDAVIAVNAGAGLVGTFHERVLVQDRSFVTAASGA